jgi:hypothetical protein
MSPVSLVLAKLHALRHFSQSDRQDFVHLLVSLQAANEFIKDTLKQSPHLALWNCNRLIDAYRQKPNRKIEQAHGFQILSAVPIDSIQREAQHANLSRKDRRRLQNFLTIHWPTITGANQAKPMEF